MVEFRLLGDIEAHVDGRPVDLGHLQRRCVLAVLLVEPDRIVPVERLVALVWAGRRLPHNPRAAVQQNMTMLRKALSGNVEITWRNPGYRLAVQPEAVDLHRFDRLVDQARAADDDDRAATLFERALGLWRGRPFAGVDLPWFNEVRAAAAKRREAAWLDLVDVQLRRGRHAQVLAELSARAGRDPLDERLAGQHMLALYRSGRQADALAHYRQLRQRLAEELGSDPGQPLQRLHQQILTTDPALAAPPAPAPVAPRAVHVPTPRQLPAQPRLFTGRSRELAALDEHFRPGGTMPISVITGTGGIGKTWLALHWAHRRLDRFPDGQLHVDLRGFSPDGEPVDPVAALRGLLGALGVGPAATPPEPDAQAALYRSLLAGRRVLVVLDNARDSAQVTPLLPGSPTCAVLVTSRHRLDGLSAAHGARPLELDVLGDAEARELLIRHVGRDRVTAEPDAVEELLGCCTGLPLAIGVVAARAARHPRFPLAALAEELREHESRLDGLDTGDTTAGIRAVLSWSHRAMSPDAAAAFGLLGLAPGADISAPAATSLLGVPVASARRVLCELERGHLLQQHLPGRYRMHDLVRLYAADRAECDHPEAARAQAVRRVVDFYLHTAFAADRLLQPLLPPIRSGEPAAGCRPLVPRDRAAAIEWFTAEHANLLAAQDLAAARGWADSVYRLAWLLTTFFYRQGRFHAALAAWRAGHAATEQLDDPVSQAGAHQLLGAIFAELGRPAEALRHLTRAERVGDLAAQAYTHHTLGWFWSLQGDPRRALDHAAEARRLYRATGMPAGETRQLTVTAWYHAQLGDYAQARDHCALALDMARRHQYTEDEALALGILGHTAQHTGRPAAAVDWYQRSRTLLRRAGSSYFEADALDRLGQAHAALGQVGPARSAWEQALVLYRSQHRAAEADRVRQQVVSLPPGEPSGPARVPEARRG